jgi:hypothetical protein
MAITSTMRAYTYHPASKYSFTEGRNRSGELFQRDAQKDQQQFLLDLPRFGFCLWCDGEIIDVSKQVIDLSDFATIFKYIKEYFKQAGCEFDDNTLLQMLQGAHQNGFGAEHLFQYAALTQQNVSVKKFVGTPTLFFDRELSAFVLKLSVNILSLAYSGSFYSREIKFVENPEQDEVVSEVVSKNAVGSGNIESKLRFTTHITIGKDATAAQIDSCVMEVGEGFLADILRYNPDIKLSVEEQNIILMQKDDPKFCIIMPLLLAVFSGNLPGLLFLSECAIDYGVTKNKFLDICIDKFAKFDEQILQHNEFWLALMRILEKHSDLYGEITESCFRYKQN